jgi:hypothetical protein
MSSALTELKEKASQLSEPERAELALSLIERGCAVVSGDFLHLSFVKRRS